MRYMVMHKLTPEIEAEQRPSPRLIEEMGALMGEGFKSGKVLDGAGLRSSAHRTRLAFKGGACRESKGPYAGSDRELIAGFLKIKVRSRDEAIAWAKRLGAVLGDSELEVGLVTEPWDLGVMPKPAGEVPMQFLILNKADARSEAGTPPPAREVEAMGKLIAEMKQAGVLLAAEGLQPSSAAARIRYQGGKRTFTDGPFTETKELVSGYSIINVPTREEAVAFADRYARILGDIEVDVRPLYEAGDRA